jgi:hypothetical protein
MRWNGTLWSVLDTGVKANFLTGHAVKAMAVGPAGELVAAGDFAIAGSGNAFNIARFDGVAWSAMPTAGGATSGEVRITDMTVSPDGSVLAAGLYTIASGTPGAGGVFRRGPAGWV